MLFHSVAKSKICSAAAVRNGLIVFIDRQISARNGFDKLQSQFPFFLAFHNAGQAILNNKRKLYAILLDKGLFQIFEEAYALSNIAMTEETINQFIAAVDECEFERYAPGDAKGNMSRTFETAKSMIMKIENCIRKRRLN